MNFLEFSVIIASLSYLFDTPPVSAGLFSYGLYPRHFGIAELSLFNII